MASIAIKIPRPSGPESLSSTLSLRVPLSELAELALRPVRWMLLVAWGLVNCEGRFQDEDGVALRLDMTIDQLKAGAVYTFLPGGDESFHIANLKHCHTKPTGPGNGSAHESNLSSSGSQSTTKSKFSGGNYNQILTKRDDGRCMFTGRYAAKGTARVHVLPDRFSRNPHLVAERQFAITHPLDPMNTMVLLTALHEQYDTATGFVLATDDRFLRDEDVPPPLGAAPPSSSWRARDTGQTSRYIWQSLRRMWHEDHATFTVVQLNQRARFALASGEADSEWCPCPRAVNYVYAAVMVQMYLEVDDDVRALLVRSVPPAAESGSASEEDSEAPRRCTRHRARLAPKLSPVELMMRLTHAHKPNQPEGQLEEQKNSETRRDA